MSVRMFMSNRCLDFVEKAVNDCSQCMRDLESRPNDMCPAPYHWRAYAEWLERQISDLAKALPRCNPYGREKCGKIATHESFDAAGDPFSTCHVHAVNKYDSAQAKPYRWASPMATLLSAIRVSTSSAGSEP